MEPTISIILPIYNTGRILYNTLESILNQTFTDYELLVIDDGSNKESLQILRSFMERDKRIKLISKSNGGVCSARNVGIECAQGKYITFCDHDDVYEETLLEKEYNLLIKTGGDIVVVGAKHIYDDGSTLFFGEDLYCGTKEVVLNNAIQILRNQTIGTIWNILYKKKLLEDIRFDESLKTGHEDIIFNLQVLRKINTFASIKEPLYIHYIRKNMSTSAKFYHESLHAISLANDYIASFVRECFSNYDESAYINLQGEYIRTLAAYYMHLKPTYFQFREQIKKIDYVEVDSNFIDLPIFRNKDRFTFFCLQKKHYFIMYMAFRINLFVRR